VSNLSKLTAGRGIYTLTVRSDIPITVDLAGNALLKEESISWISQVTAGDANGDGLFNSSDLVAVFQAGKYETGSPATWAEGDWNGDGYFDSSDLIVAFQAGYEQSAAVTSITSLWNSLSLRRRQELNHDAIDKLFARERELGYAE
jgi:hypothetical protein